MKSEFTRLFASAAPGMLAVPGLHSARADSLTWDNGTTDSLWN